MRRVFEFAKRTLPRISQTERTALESGVAGVEKHAFTGRLSSASLIRKLSPAQIPASDISYVDAADTVARSTCGYRASERTTTRDDPSWSVLREAGYLGLIVPKEHGGAGISGAGLSSIIQRLASASAKSAIHTMVPASLGPAELVHNYGTPEQKKDLLPKLANGAIPCFGLTSTDAGSDAAGSMTDEGVLVSKNGEPRIILNCNKRYITLAPVADLVGIAFKLRDPNSILNNLGINAKEGSIALAIVERGRTGLTIGPYSDPLGVGFANGTVTCTNLELKLDDIIGGEKGLDSGWKYLMECLAAGRGVALPASAAGSAKQLTNAVSGYACVREQFKRPIADFEGVQEKLARMARNTYEIVSLVEMTNAILASGSKPPVLSAIVKYKTTELARDVVNDAMDVVGGAGICMGEKNFVAEHYMSAPIGITVEGSNTMTRSLLIFGQGAVRSHPYALKLLHAVEKDDFSSFRAGVYGAIGMYSRLFFSLSGPGNGPYVKFFALSSTLSLALGGELKKREFLSGRYADLLSDLMSYTAIEWHNAKLGDHGIVVRSSLDELQVKMNGTIRQLVDNHPHSFIHGVLASWCGVTAVPNRSWDVHTSAVVDDLRRPGSQLRTLFDKDVLKIHPTVVLIDKAIRKEKGPERDALSRRIIETDVFQ